MPLKMRTPDGCVPRPSRVPFAVWTRSAACVATAVRRIKNTRVKIFITHLYNIIEPHRTYCRGGPPWPPGVEFRSGMRACYGDRVPRQAVSRYVVVSRDRIPRRAATEGRPYSTFRII